MNQQELKEGHRAPDFTLNNQDQKPVSLSSLRGQTVVLFFYPQDDTPGCTKEACSLRNGVEDGSLAGVTLIGISPDNILSHQQFRMKYQLPFDLLTDPDHKVLELYGAWGEKNLYGKVGVGVKRSTIVIDSEGLIKKIIRKVNTDDHAVQVKPYL